MPHQDREVLEGIQQQGDAEGLIYDITVTNWGTAPTSPAMVVTRVSDSADVTSQVSTGSASASGNVITLPKISGLTAGVQYIVTVTFTVTGFGPGECWFYIYCDA